MNLTYLTSHRVVCRGLLTAALATTFGTMTLAQEAQLPVEAVSASADDGNVPANTLDGNFSTRWSAKGEQYISYDLGAVRTVSSVKIAWYKGNLRRALFQVGTSVDGAVWTELFNGTSSGSTLELESYDLADSSARYVMIIGHGNSLDLWNSITETRIYGTPGTEEPPPSQLLNLANWKLTLPVDTSHAGSPDEYLQPELATFQHPDYFHANATTNGVVFKAHCGGATTSGSGYPRSELREMTNDGRTLASWSTTSGTHTMEITQAITHLPVVKPHVVAGQIHDAGDDVIVFRLEGQKLFIDLNGAQGPILTSVFKLGDVFSVKFVAHDGQVECYYNGRLVYRYAVSASGCYFKAGCYTQSNTSRGDAPTAYGEVVIYALSVRHEQAVREARCAVAPSAQ